MPTVGIGALNKPPTFIPLKRSIKIKVITLTENFKEKAVALTLYSFHSLKGERDEHLFSKKK